MLSKAVTGLQSKGAPAPKLPTPPPKVAPSAQVTGQKLTSAPPTFAAKAATPARPSLIVDISNPPSQKRIDRPRPTSVRKSMSGYIIEATSLCSYLLRSGQERVTLYLRPARTLPHTNSKPSHLMLRADNLVSCVVIPNELRLELRV
jgi:hypothetical protein